MAKYTVTDPTTNKSVDLEGDSPPTEEELNQIFSQVHGTPSQPTQQPLSMPTGKDVLGAAGQALGATPLFGMAKGMEGFQKGMGTINTPRSEEHTSELQSHVNLVCRLLLEKKKNNKTNIYK